MERTIFPEPVRDGAGPQPIAHALPPSVRVNFSRGCWDVCGQSPNALHLPLTKRIPFPLGLQSEAASKCACLTKWKVFPEARGDSMPVPDRKSTRLNSSHLGIS